jgi:hypothetical protein
LERVRRLRRARRSNRLRPLRRPETLPNRAEKNWAVLPGPSSFPARSPPRPSLVKLKAFQLEGYLIRALIIPPTI